MSNKTLLDLILGSTGRAPTGLDSPSNGLTDLKKELCWWAHSPSVYRPSKVISSIMRTSQANVRSYRNELEDEGRLSHEEFIWQHSILRFNKSKGGKVVGYISRLREKKVSEWGEDEDYVKLRRYLNKRLSTNRVKGYVRKGKPVSIGFPHNVMEFFVNCMDYELRERGFVESRKMSEDSDRDAMVKSGKGKVFEYVPTVFDEALEKLYPLSISDYLLDVEADKIHESQPCFVSGCESGAGLTGDFFKGSYISTRKFRVFMVDRSGDELSLDERIAYEVMGREINRLHVPVYECGEGHLSPFMIDDEITGFKLGPNVEPEELLS